MCSSDLRENENVGVAWRHFLDYRFTDSYAYFGRFWCEFAWLVPVWTRNPSKAATAIEFIEEDKENSFLDLAKGARGQYR